MKRRNWLWLAGGSVILAVVIAWFQPVPGYMDAEYYYAGGLRIANNLWGSEPFLWNYLDNPAGLPHPAFSYWMPLPSILAAAGMKLTGRLDFVSARIFFILLSGLIPLLTVKLSQRLGASAGQARLAGWLAVFSGFYALYTGLTETFTISMVLGGSLLLILSSDWAMWKRGLSGGALVGLMHLTRADGLLWWGVLLLWLVLEWRRVQPLIRFRQVLAAVGLAGLAYFAVVSPWFGRNLNEWSSLLPPGGSRTLWLTDYNQTFLYPAETLTAERWWASGLGAILTARRDALLLNLKTLAGIQGGVALLPFILLAGWRLRRNLLVQTGVVMWLGVLFLMTVVFPFAGSRGGFFHSGAPLQPFLWALAGIGLGQAIEWGSKVRGWQPKTAWKFFSRGLIGLMALVTLVVAGGRLLGGETGDRWDAGYERYQAVESWLRQKGGEGSIVMVNNPPGYYVAGKRAAIVIPDGDMETIREVAERYGAQFLVLEVDTTPQLRELYDNPRSLPGLIYLDEAAGAQIFQFEGNTP